MTGTFPVMGRVLQSVRGDRRTLALVLVAPVFIIFLFGQVLDQVPPGAYRTDIVPPVLLGFFVFFLTYLLTAVGFLRERQTGTLERLLVAPLRRSGVVLGYVLGYGTLAFVQSGALLLAGIWFLDVTFEHGVVLFLAVELLGAVVALGLGILVSFFARNEFQVLQFIPLIIAPQVILGGVFVSVERLPWWLEWPANVMPLTYILKAMNYVVLDQGDAGDLLLSVGVLAAYTVLSIVLAAVAVRRPG